jgi:hypothetical protein
VSRASLIDLYISSLPVGATDRTPAELRAEAEQAVAEATAKVDFMRQNGDLKQLNARYKLYRRTQMERREAAIPYSAFLERRVATIVRQVAATGRAI